MAIVNDLIFNMAFQGALEGMLEGRPFESSTATDYEAQCDAADAYAQEVDSLIAEDATISTGGGDASVLVPTTSAIQANEIFKGGLIRALSRAQFAGRVITNTTAANYASEAAAVKAAYTQAVTHFTNAA